MSNEFHYGFNNNFCLKPEYCESIVNVNYKLAACWEPIVPWSTIRQTRIVYISINHPFPHSLTNLRFPDIVSHLIVCYAIIGLIYLIQVNLYVKDKIQIFLLSFKCFIFILWKQRFKLTKQDWNKSIDV